MNIYQLVTKLSNIDEIDTWPSHSMTINPSMKGEVYERAIVLWIKRMLQSGKLLVHPEVAEQLYDQNWKPNDLQKKMIWASILGTNESSDRKTRFDMIKARLIKKHGKDWWEDVYKRQNHVYAVKERMRKIHSGPVVSAFIMNTHLGASCEADERTAALKMLPKN